MILALLERVKTCFSRHYLQDILPSSTKSTAPIAPIASCFNCFHCSYCFMASSSIIINAQTFRDRFNYQSKKPGPVTKPAVELSIKTRSLRLATCPPPRIDEDNLITRFDTHRRTELEKLDVKGFNPSDKEVNRKISYIKEQKLVIICYTKITYVKKHDEL